MPTVASPRGVPKDDRSMDRRRDDARGPLADLVADLVADPRLVDALGALDALPPDDLPAAIAALEGAAARCWARLRLAGGAATGDGTDRLLTLDEAAAVLAVAPDWLRRQKTLPFRVPLSPGQVRYSARGIDRYIARLAGRRT
jgi:hypothetical protein